MRGGKHEERIEHAIERSTESTESTESIDRQERERALNYALNARDDILQQFDFEALLDERHNHLQKQPARVTAAKRGGSREMSGAQKLY
jgi:hypothetical protein